MTSRVCSPREELANRLTHGAGLVASVIGSVVLVALATHTGLAAVLAAAVFGSSLILLYAASTLYHTFRTPSIRQRLRTLDHCAIFVLIAGTYTPITLLGLKGFLGWGLFGVVWALALAGVIFKLFFMGRFPRISTGIYIAMGWLILVAARPAIEALSPATLAWLLVGGLAYTGGTWFYHHRTLPYAHAIWHLFVLAGSVSHAIAIGIQVSGS